MSVQVKTRRDTAANIATAAGASGELWVDTTNNRVVVNDGTTVGGFPAARLSEVATASRTSVSDVSYTALSTDRIIAYSALTASRVVTLPAASSFQPGVVLWVLDETGACSGSVVITINRSGSDTIDGSTSQLIDMAYGAMAFTSNGSSKWTIVHGEPNISPATIGVNTAPDTTNKLSVSSSAILFNNIGTNIQVKVNKNAAGNSGSFLFQTGFSGRAEIGCTGDDDFHFKTSPNGSSFVDALILGSAAGLVTLPQGQLKYPNSPNPSTDAHTLDQYEEGTWTPALAIGGSTTGITYSTQAGTYVKIGQLVNCWMAIALTSIGSSTGTVTISGLPYTVQATNAGSVLMVYASGLNMLSATPVIGYAGITTTIINLGYATMAGFAYLQNTHISNTTVLHLAINYRSAT